MNRLMGAAPDAVEGEPLPVWTVVEFEPGRWETLDGNGNRVVGSTQFSVEGPAYLAALRARAIEDEAEHANRANGD